MEERDCLCADDVLPCLQRRLPFFFISASGLQVDETASQQQPTFRFPSLPFPSLPICLFLPSFPFKSLPFPPSLPSLPSFPLLPPLHCTTVSRPTRVAVLRTFVSVTIDLTG